MITHSSPVNLSVQFTDSSSSTTFRIRNKQIPANEVVDIINQTLVLEEGDALKMTAGTAGELQGVISYAQIDRSQEMAKKKPKLKANNYTKRTPKKDLVDIQRD